MCCLAERLPGAAGASFILTGVSQDPFYLGFGHADSVSTIPQRTDSYIALTPASLDRRIQESSQASS